eukprot:10913286-Karenia_brevis.AAC.1
MVRGTSPQLGAKNANSRGQIVRNKPGSGFFDKTADPGAKIAKETRGSAVLHKRCEPWRREAPGSVVWDEKCEA